MIIFFIRLGLIAIIAMTGIKCISVNTFGPMLTGYCLLMVAGVWALIELVLAVEQILKNRKPVHTHVLKPCGCYQDIDCKCGGPAMTQREAHLIYVTEHPNKYTLETVNNAHLQLDELYYNRIHQKD